MFYVNSQFVKIANLREFSEEEGAWIYLVLIIFAAK